MHFKRVLLLLSACLVLSAVASAQSVVASWAFSSESRENGSWTSSHSIAATRGEGLMSFDGTSASFGYGKGGTVTVGKVKEGDSFILSVPVKTLPKGADIDVAVYMGIDKEGGPRKWVCEYFDGRRWRGTGEDVSFSLKKYKSANETSYVHQTTKQVVSA